AAPGVHRASWAACAGMPPYADRASLLTTDTRRSQPVWTADKLRAIAREIVPRHPEESGQGQSEFSRRGMSSHRSYAWPRRPGLPAEPGVNALDGGLRLGDHLGGVDADEPAVAQQRASVDKDDLNVPWLPIEDQLAHPVHLRGKVDRLGVEDD